MTHKRRKRADDRLVVPMFLTGAVFMLVAAGLAAFTDTSDKVVIFIGLMGALLMPTHRIMSAFRLYRGTGGGA